MAEAGKITTERLERASAAAAQLALQDKAFCQFSNAFKTSSQH